MKVKLLDIPAGKLNRAPWPKIGSVVEVDHTLGSFLVSKGIAEKATEGADELTDDAEDVDVPDVAAPKLIAWVDNDPLRARAALAIEKAKARPRKGLLEELERFAS